MPYPAFFAYAYYIYAACAASVVVCAFIDFRCHKVTRALGTGPAVYLSALLVLVLAADVPADAQRATMLCGCVLAFCAAAVGLANACRPAGEANQDLAGAKQ